MGLRARTAIRAWVTLEEGKKLGPGTRVEIIGHVVSDRDERQMPLELQGLVELECPETVRGRDGLRRMGIHGPRRPSHSEPPPGPGPDTPGSWPRPGDDTPQSG